MVKEFMQIFAVNVKMLISPMSVNEFSKKIGIPQSTLARYLNCQREVSAENLIKIANFFDVSIDFLVGRKDY